MCSVLRCSTNRNTLHMNLSRLYSNLFKSDFFLIFDCGEPASQYYVMVSDNLRGGDNIVVPGAVTIFDQGHFIVEAERTAATGINAIIGLNASYDQLFDA